MSAMHYRDTCSRCIDLEKQISELRPEQQVRNLNRFWTYQIKQRDWPASWSCGSGAPPPAKFLAYFLSFFFWFLCGLNAEMIWLGFYPTRPVLVACALMILLIELTIVKTCVYVAADVIGSKTIGYGPKAPYSGHSSRRTPIDTCPKV